MSQTPPAGVPDTPEVIPDMPVAQPQRVGRRNLLGYVGAVGAGAVLGGTAGFAVPRPADAPPVTAAVTRQSYSPHGEHQAGITSPKPAAFHAVSLTLLPGTDKAALGRLMRTWTTDIENLMSGVPVPGDHAGVLAQSNVSLTVTVGFGPGVFQVAGIERSKPTGLIDVPPMAHDRLDERWNGGDLLLLISADDDTTVCYAEDRLLGDAAPFASLRWVQVGSWRGTDAAGKPVTGRNLFGQVDGTANPQGQDLARALWNTDGPDWFDGGTCLVIRRIEFNMPNWNRLTRSAQEDVVGRRLDTGAPLGKSEEFDALDLRATKADGAPVIARDAHSRRAHPDTNSGRRMLRRAWNYQHSAEVATKPGLTVGLIFMAFVANVAEQFVPVQASLDAEDALNEWTTTIGSAVFAILPGWQPGQWLAQGLLK